MLLRIRLCHPCIRCIHNLAIAACTPSQMVPEYMEWFANYLVVKRAAQEANYHKLYVALVGCAEAEGCCMRSHPLPSALQC